MPRKADITIDMDKKCRRCGKGGSTESGLCLKCVTAKITQPMGDPGDYVQSDRIEEMAKRIIPLHHPHLLAAKIAYLMKLADPDKPPVIKRQGKRPHVGTARTVPALYYCLTGFDFIIEINEGWWDLLSLEQQEAVVDHELCHCKKDEDGWYLINHDVEDFAEILARHGLWHPRLEAFVAAAQQHLPFGDEPGASAHSVQ